MEILIDRKWKKDEYTISKVYVNGKDFGCNALEDKDRGLNQNMSIAEIAKLKVYGQTAIPTGRYLVTYTYSNHFKKYLPYINNTKGFTGVRIHCLTPDMEILTENGWQNLASYKNNTPNKCFSYNLETNKIELVNIDNFIEQDYDGELYKCNGKRINYAVTNKHRMLVAIKDKNLIYNWGFRTADNIPGQTKFRTAGIKDGEDITPQQKTLYRLMMAVQADGYILNRSKTSTSVRFHFTKDRKIERVKQLITDLGETYSTFVDSENKTHILLSPALSNEIGEYMNPCHYLFNYKELPLCLLNLKSEDIKDLLMEYLFFDGRWENYLKCNANMTISSTNINTLNTLQAMACLCNMRSYIKKGNGSSCYEIVLYNDQDVVMPEKETYSTESYNGKVWCLSNVNTTLIVRQNNRPMVIGNCGNTAKDSLGCILIGKNDAVGCINNSRYWTNLLIAEMQKAWSKKEEVFIVIR